MSGHTGAQAIETSVQVALRIRPIVTDPKNVSKGRSKAETEVLSLVERSSSYAYNTSESSASSPTPGQHDIPQQVAVIPLQRHFTFDQVFGTYASQEEVYHGSVKRMVDRFMEGYNVTIMAYGQTSSGKTYTMGTGALSSEDRGSPSEGIIPRAMNQLFQAAKRPPIQNYPGCKVPGLKTTFRVSFVEIYNEDLIDLLVKGDLRPPVSIREDTKGNIFWTGVQEIVVSSVEEVIHLLWFGSQNRQTHSTEMNEKSSRSHAIFSITLRQEKFVPAHPPPVPLSSSTISALASEGRNSPTFRRQHVKSPSLTGHSTNGMSTSGSSASLTSSGGSPSSIPTPFTSGIQAPGSKLKRASIMPESPSAPSVPEDPEPEGEWVTLTSKFHFVDLAGSERLKRTSAIGDRAKEGISINAGLHALGNVISALGDPSKKASHVPYRDSKLTRLLQDSLGGNALALMIACVSPSELNLSETMNTLKYANRARNIKNSSSLNQELNMDNPDYLRSIIQKLKQEIKMLREGATKKSLTVNTESAVAADKANPSYRLSTSSTTSTVVHHDIDDRFSSSPSPSPSPSMPRRLSHYHSRESIATDISHGYLNAVQEEDNDDLYSETSSSGRTTIGRPSIPSLMLPSVDYKSFQDFVEPVIEEYEKVISGLETHLAMTQAALNHSEQMLEEQQGRINVIEQEKSVLLSQKQQPKQRSTPSPPPVALAELQRHRDLQKELETALQTVQNQLKEAEARKIESKQYISGLESKLAQEQAAQERIQKLLDKQEEERKREKATKDPAVVAKELELQALTQTVLALEEKYRQHKEAVEAETKVLQELQEPHQPETEIEKEQREAKVAQYEGELVEKLQVKASLEQELESTRERQELLTIELESEAKVPRIRTDSALEDDSKVSEQVVKSLGINEIRVPLSSESFAQVQLLLETQLAEARQSERQLKQETVDLAEKLEKLEKDHKVSLELEEMLHLAVSDLEGRLKVSQDSETKHLAELEENLARIQELEERSTNAEKDALLVVEELKAKLTEANASAEERLTDELIELLEKMEKERSKVAALQTQVENQLVELATERTRASELESDRDTIQTQWDADKARIETLEKDIEAQFIRVQEKTALVVALEERLEKHEEIVSAKLQLEQELEQKSVEHEKSLESKSTLISDLEEKIAELETSLDGSGQTSILVAEVRAELAVAQEELTKSQAQVHDQEQELKDLREKVGLLEAETLETRDAVAAKDAQHAEELQSLQQQLKIAEADRDDAETQLEDAERRHQSVEDSVKSLQNNVAIHLATIETLQSRLSESLLVSSSSRPGSMSASTLGSESDDQAVRKLEAELSRYRALVRENEREIKRLSDDLEMLASEFSNAATAFEDAEEEMKAKISDMEQFLEEKNLTRMSHNNGSSVSLASSLASSYTTKNRECGLHPSTSSTSLSTNKTQQQQQLATLKSERDQALQSSEELSLIVAELNEKNHSLQERLLTLEHEHESAKLQHVLEKQSQQNELRTLKDRAERLDRSSPSLTMLASARDGHEDERASVVYERILRHKSSTSSEGFGQINPEDTLATPRQSWSTTTTNSTSQPGSQIRTGRHESTLIQQAKQIKLLEERIAEMQKQQESSSSTDGANALSSPNIGLGIIQRKNSEPDLSRSNSSTLMTRQSMERMSPNLRALSTFPITPPTPPPTAPLPTPPVMAVSNKGHLNNNAPPSPRIGGTMTFENGPGSATSSSSPHMRPSRTSSFGKNSPRRGERDSGSSVFSDSASTTSTNISPATAQALQGVEVNELRAVVDTLAHQVQALKIEQAMQQGKVARLETSLAETEEKLRTARTDRDQLLADKEAMIKELEKVRADWNLAKLKSERDRAILESALEKERKEREKAVETRTIMEQRMEELLSKKSKFGCF